MSQGISDPIARATTITFYTDVAAFNTALGFKDDSVINVALVAPSGEVHWRGRFDEAVFDDLTAMLRRLTAGA